MNSRTRDRPQESHEFRRPQLTTAAANNDVTHAHFDAGCCESSHPPPLHFEHQMKDLCSIRTTGGTRLHQSTMEKTLAAS
eukprot:4253471-Amphidinium_carterae.1